MRTRRAALSGLAAASLADRHEHTVAGIAPINPLNSAA